MLPKPSYLGPEYAVRFRDRGVVETYYRRPPYPAETFDILASLILDEPRRLLDAGSGRGDIARPMLSVVEQVDAVDFSLPMIEKGRMLPDGDNPNLRWIYGRIEEAELSPPYALITAGESLHWMEWDEVLPRFRELLTPHGTLVIVSRDGLPVPWDEEILTVIRKYSTSRNYQSFDLIHELEIRKLYQPLGEKRTTPLTFVQSLDGYIESFHSRSSQSREHMTEGKAAAFDDEMRAIVSRFTTEGQTSLEITLQIEGRVAWGKPLVGV